MGVGTSSIVKEDRRLQKQSVLVQRICRYDWEGVLERVRSHPREVYSDVKLDLYGLPRRRVTPLHLVCACRPPYKVVEAMVLADKGKSAGVFLKNVQQRNQKRPPPKSTEAASNDAQRQKSSNTLSHNNSSDSTVYASPPHSSRWQAPRKSPLSAFKLRSSERKDHDAYRVTDDDDIFGNYGSGQMNQGLLETDEEEMDQQSRLLKQSVFDGFDRTRTLYDNHLMGILEEECDDEETREFLENQSMCPETEIPEEEGTVQPEPPKRRDKRDDIVTPSREPGSQREKLVRRISEKSFQKEDAVPDVTAGFWLPLHIAVLFRASPQVIEILLRANPLAAKLMNGMGMLPLHLVCSNIIEPVPPFMPCAYAKLPNTKWNAGECVHLLLRAFPEAMFMTSSNLDSVIPKHYAVDNFEIRHGDRKVILELLSQPHAAFNEAIIPLYSGSTKQIIHSIRSSDATETQQRQRKIKSTTATKLWTFVSEKSWRQASQRLTRAPDEAAVWTMIEDDSSSTGDSCYRLPLHRACALKPPVSFVKLLVEAYPNALRSHEKFASLPLHIATAFHADESVIGYLVSNYPKAVREKDAWNRLPLHIACVAGTTLPVIHRLLEAYPAALDHMDNWGRTPLHCASQSQCPNKKLTITALMVQRILLTAPVVSAPPTPVAASIPQFAPSLSMATANTPSSFFPEQPSFFSDSFRRSLSAPPPKTASDEEASIEYMSPDTDGELSISKGVDPSPANDPTKFSDEISCADSAYYDYEYEEELSMYSGAEQTA